MSESEVSPKTLIEEQEELEFDITDALTQKLESVTQEITIRDIGVYLHPMLCLRDSSSYWDSNETEYDQYEYDAIEFPRTSARVSLLAYVLDNDNQHTTDTYENWLNQNHLTTEEYEEYKDWAEETDDPLNFIYDDTSESIWSLAGETEYSQGTLSPTPTVSILFEDDSGVLYCGLIPLPDNESSIEQLFTDALEATEKEIEGEDSDEESDEEESGDENADSDDSTEDDTEDKTDDSEMKTVYESTGNSGEVTNLKLKIGSVDLQMVTVLPVTWYSYPMVDAALSDVSEEVYDTLTSYNPETGWYNFTLDLLTVEASSKHSLALTTPFDYTNLSWRASIPEEAPLRILLTAQENADYDEIDVECKPFISLTLDEDNNEVLLVSRTGTWGIRNPNASESSSEKPEDMTDEPRPETETAANQDGQDDTDGESTGLMSRLLNRDG